MQDSPDCELCGQPGTPSWGGSILCESCYGTLGATCAGRPRKPRPSEPEPKTEVNDSAVC